MRWLALMLLALALLPARALASPDQEAMIQDDDELIYTTAAHRAKRLDELKALGAQRIRVTVLWRAIAPDKDSRTKPAGFDGRDPAAYPNGSWRNYDDLVRAALARGLAVNFNVTGPSPNWANKKPPRPDIADNYEPSPKEFFDFVGAVGRRYSGTYPDGSYDPLPRVDFWSIWNEPNHSGWLTPTWQRSGKGFFERSASLYRALLDYGYAALQVTGHGQDTILFGDTAPVGSDTSRDVKRFMTPLRFVRALYCVDQKQRRLKGRAAKRLGCPKSRAAFVKGHPALFDATGYAHHPYQLLTAPEVRPADRNYVTIGVLSRLERALDAIQRRYGRSRRLPLYLTEFGYQSRPDPLGVSLAKQAVYLNQSEYIASRDRRVRTFAQFLLRDGPPPASRTFQSGLLTRAGKRKPAYAAWRMPIWVTGHRVWGLVRPATSNVTVAIQFRRKSASKWRTVRTVTTQGARHWFIASVRWKGRGSLRLVSGKLRSRSAPVR